MNVVGPALNTLDEEQGKKPKASSSTMPSTINRLRGRGNTKGANSTGKKSKKLVTQAYPNKLLTPKRRSAEDTYFEREMCCFYWGNNYNQDDVTGLDWNVSGNFVENVGQVVAGFKTYVGSCISHRFDRKRYRWLSPSIIVSKTESSYT